MDAGRQSGDAMTSMPVTEQIARKGARLRIGWTERIYRCVCCGYEIVCFAKQHDGHDTCWMCQERKR